MNSKTVTKEIVRWLRKKVKLANAKGVVVGLSGGVDSAVVAVLCKKAFDNQNKNSLCLILPCETPKKEINDARKIVYRFNLKTKIIDLTPVYRQLIKIIPKGDKVAKGNLKARLRMLTLYYFANKENLLVVGAGNKSELKTGYFTKYGDGGVDLLPIGDLTKTEVRELARYLKIPDEIINKVPTAGLWNGQTDEEELGITYNELDRILKGRTKGIEKNKLLKVKKLIKLTEHKRKIPEIWRDEK